jgi:MFS transporter, DHA3 family, macrolide efflux protein
MLKNNKPFLISLTAFSFSSIGDWLDLFALQIIFYFHWHASPYMLGLMMALYMAPGIIVSQFAGYFTGRFNHAWLMTVTDFLSGVMTLCILYSGHMGWALLWIVLRSCFTSINGPTQQSIIKRVVVQDDLMRASSIQATIKQLARVLGPLLGTVIAVWLSPFICLGLNAGSFFLSAILYFLLRAKTPLETSTMHSLLQAWAAGWKTLWAHRTVCILLIIASASFFFVMLTESELVVLLHQLSPNNHYVLGWVMAASGVGALVMATILGRKKSIADYRHYFSAAFLSLGIGYMGLSFFQPGFGLAYLVLMGLFNGIGFGVMMIVFSFMVKNEFSHADVGAVAGLSAAIQSLFFMLGGVSAGAIAHALGVSMMYMATGVVLVVFAGFPWCVPIKKHC